MCIISDYKIKSNRKKKTTPTPCSSRKRISIHSTCSYLSKKMIPILLLSSKMFITYTTSKGISKRSM